MDKCGEQTRAADQPDIPNDLSLGDHGGMRSERRPRTAIKSGKTITANEDNLVLAAA